MFAFFPYGGTGGSPVEHPEIRNWFARTLLKCRDNPLVADVGWHDFSDTPITMTRNKAVLTARQTNADILIMVDSDMYPDMYLPGGVGAGGPHSIGAKPFFDTAIDLIDLWYERGPIIAAAPYCGPPPEENPYVFLWDGWPSEGQNISTKLRMMTRNEATIQKGVSSVAALPTGLIAYDMRVFKYSEPTEFDGKGWFYYSYTDVFASEKSGTEDVMATRDLSLAVQSKLGYNPLKCLWDCWAGHMKPRIVGKPTPIYASQIEARFRQAAIDGIQLDERMVEVGEPQSRI